MVKKKKLEIKIIFDTNVIYTGSSSDLFKKEIKELVDKYTLIPDLKVSWYLPEVVIKERKFQMLKSGLELLPALNKLERIIGHHLAITKDIIESRINETITKHLDLNSISALSIDTEKVNWIDIIHNSCNRIAPFEDGDKEKGFRDAIVLESVLQLINLSPSSKSVCRIIFATNDKLLQNAFLNRTNGLTNIKLVNSIEEVESFINVLSSEITEELINSIVIPADELFLMIDDQDTFYYKEGIKQKIVDKYLNELQTLPLDAIRRENSTWLVRKPGFVKKLKQKIYWKTVISVEAKAYKKKVDISSLPNLLPQSQVLTTKPITTQTSKSQSPTSEELFAEGKTRFEVIWSVTLTTAKTLKSPKLEEFSFIETTWENL